MRFIIMFICSLVLNSVFAEVINYQTDTFANIAAQYKELRADPKTTSYCQIWCMPKMSSGGLPV